MRADIDKQGRLLLQPESQTEEAALFAWWERDIASPSIAKSRVCAMAYEPGRGEMTMQQFLAAAVEADAVLNRRRAMEIESVRIRQMGAEARAEMDAAMTATQATESLTYRLKVPLGVVQGQGNSDPPVTLAKGHQELAAACESEAKKHELAVRAGVEWLVKSLHASIWRELSTFK